MYHEDFYKELPPYPNRPSASNMIVRALDGLGFRLYWALDGLEEKDFEYRLCEGAKSIFEIVRHIWGLVNWIHINFYSKESSRPKKIIDQGKHALQLIHRLRNEFLNMDDDDLEKVKLEHGKYWNLINAPIADALSHVGQVNILRRAVGKPAQLGDTIN
jgi:hypothetical protein